MKLPRKVIRQKYTKKEVAYLYAMDTLSKILKAESRTEQVFILASLLYEIDTRRTLK